MMGVVGDPPRNVPPDSHPHAKYDFNVALSPRHCRRKPGDGPTGVKKQPTVPPSKIYTVDGSKDATMSDAARALQACAGNELGEGSEAT